MRESEPTSSSGPAKRVLTAAALRDALAAAAIEARDQLRGTKAEAAAVRHDARDEQLEAAKRSLAVLWGVDDPPRRGPKATLTRDAIVEAAIEIADAEGIGAVSMRAIANALGVGPMSLYRHVPGKDELLALMVDRVAGEMPRPDGLPGTWREKLEAIAWGEWLLALHHPWALGREVGGTMVRPNAGPSSLATYESSLAAAAETGLPAREVVQAVHAVYFLVEGAAGSAVEQATVEQRTGISNEDWWAAQDSILHRVLEPTRYPTFQSLTEAGVFGDPDPDAPYEDPVDFEGHFRYALATLLDGIAARVASHQGV